MSLILRYSYSRENKKLLNKRAMQIPLFTLNCFSLPFKRGEIIQQKAIILLSLLEKRGEVPAKTINNDHIGFHSLPHPTASPCERGEVIEQ
jgi:hypothetical protein